MEARTSTRSEEEEINTFWEACKKDEEVAIPRKSHPYICPSVPTKIIHTVKQYPIVVKKRSEQEEKEMDELWEVWKKDTKPSPKKRRRVDTIPTWGMLPEKDEERDTTHNPYTEAGQEREGSKKVTFYEPTHTYVLQDEFGAYPNLLLSGSKVVGYMEAFVIETQGDVSKIERVMEALKRKTFGVQTSGTLAEFKHVLTMYLNKLCRSLEEEEEEEVLLPRRYEERRVIFRQMSPKKEMTYFIPTKTLDVVETALLKLSKGDSSCIPLYHLEDPDEHRTYQEFVAHLDMDALHPWMRQLVAEPVANFPSMQNYLKELYALPSIHGTALHAYLEHRLMGRVYENMYGTVSISRNSGL